MKHNHNHDNARNAAPELMPVRFEFTHPTATTVCVAGTFNQWQPKPRLCIPQEAVAAGTRKRSYRPGTYEYCLVVDGQWMPDPLAKETVPIRLVEETRF